MTSESALERLRSIVARIAGPGQGPSAVGPDTALGDGGFWLDSLHMIEALVACEEEFGIVFDAETDLTAAHLETLGTLCRLIESKLPR